MHYSFMASMPMGSHLPHGQIRSTVEDDEGHDVQALYEISRTAFDQSNGQENISPTNVLSYQWATSGNPSYPSTSATAQQPYDPAWPSPAQEVNHPYGYEYNYGADRFPVNHATDDQQQLLQPTWSSTSYQGSSVSVQYQGAYVTNQVDHQAGLPVGWSDVSEPPDGHTYHAIPNSGGPLLDLPFPIIASQNHASFLRRGTTPAGFIPSPGPDYAAGDAGTVVDAFVAPTVAMNNGVGAASGSTSLVGSPTSQSSSAEEPAEGDGDYFSQVGKNKGASRKRRSDYGANHYSDRKAKKLAEKDGRAAVIIQKMEDYLDIYVKSVKANSATQNIRCLYVIGGGQGTATITCGAAIMLNGIHQHFWEDHAINLCTLEECPWWDSSKCTTRVKRGGITRHIQNCHLKSETKVEIPAAICGDLEVGPVVFTHSVSRADEIRRRGTTAISTAVKQAQERGAKSRDAR